MIIRGHDSGLAVPVEERNQELKNDRIRGWKCVKNVKKNQDISYITKQLFFFWRPKFNELHKLTRHVF